MNEEAKIDGIRMFELNIPFVIPFRISGGVSLSRKSLVVELKSDGVSGWGETAPFESPFYSSETVHSARVIAEEILMPRIIGKSFGNIESVNRVLTENVRGNPFARALFETAYWDLVARKNGVPLKNLVAEKLREYGTRDEYLENKPYIESGVSVGIPDDMSVETLAKWVEEYANEGYKRIKLKVRPGWDIAPTKASRGVVGDSFPMWVDGNSSFDFRDHRDILERFDEFNLSFLEQPLQNDDLYYHGQLGNVVKTPVCLDESLKNLLCARTCVESGGSTIWNIKVHRMGGLLESVKVYAYASQNGVRVWGGTMPESGLGTSAIASLASFAGFVYASDIEDSTRWFGPGNDVIEYTMDASGRIPVEGRGPGIGEINMDNFERFSLPLLEIVGVN